MASLALAEEPVITLRCDFPDVNTPAGHITHTNSTFRICTGCDSPFDGVKWKNYKTLFYYAASSDGTMAIEIDLSGNGVLKLAGENGKVTESHGKCVKG